MNVNLNKNTNKIDELSGQLQDELLNTSYQRLHNSNCSSSTNETDLSFLLSERDMSNFNNMSMHKAELDELPVFEIRSLSPHGRTPSPIDNESANNHNRNTASPEHMLGEDYVTLVELNAQICSPNEGTKIASNLETIYEGVYLNTPPKIERKSRLTKRTQEAYQMLQEHGKENYLPDSTNHT